MKTDVVAPHPRAAGAIELLIVEDEPRMREMLQRAVGEMGFAATAVGSAEQALRLMERGPGTPPPIVLLDLNLPGIGGLELLQRLRERLPSVAVIVLTGFGSLDAAQVAIRHDAIDFLTKPCRLDELEAALARAKARSAAAAPEQRDSDSSVSAGPTVASGATLDELERLHIDSALERHNGNRAAAAAELGISERTLYYRLASYARRRARWPAG
jgi:DNA-binding NtrC family response regulator